MSGTRLETKQKLPPQATETNGLKSSTDGQGSLAVKAKPRVKQKKKGITHHEIRKLLASHRDYTGKNTPIRRLVPVEAKHVLRTLDEDLRTMMRNSLGQTVVRVKVAADFSVVGTSAATNGFSVVWTPIAVADFVLFAGVFSSYTIHGIDMHMTHLHGVVAADLFPLASRTILADDPTEVSTSLTETEALNFPNMEVFNGFSGVNHAQKHHVPRPIALQGLLTATGWSPGGWVQVGTDWQGQTIGISRFAAAAAAAVGTLEYLRIGVVWDVSFTCRST